MPYVKPTPSIKVQLPSDPEYWVLWRPTLRYGQIKDVTLGATVRGERGEVSVDNGTAADGLLLAHIEDWNLDDESGNKLPLTPASLAMLVDKDVDHLSSLLQQDAEAEDTRRKN